MMMMIENIGIMSSTSNLYSITRQHRFTAQSRRRDKEDKGVAWQAWAEK
jgi:hypothetical protein